MRADGRLLERDAVIGSVTELIDRVCAGDAGAVFVVGEAGLGKTSVISRIRRKAGEAGLAVGLGRGYPMETRLPFGVLAQALDDVGAHGLLGEDDAGPHSEPDWPGRCYRLMRWLERRAGSPVFLMIDDLHWADADSVALMSFLCRRMGPVPFGLIATLRPWPAAAREAVSGLVHDGHGVLARLLPLSQQAAGALLHDQLGRTVPAAVARRAFELSAGNPLLLEQLAVAIATGAEVPDAADVGLAAFGHDVLLSRFAGVLPEGMRCAQAAAVLGLRFLPEVAVRVAGLQDDRADSAVEALAATGLIRQQPGSAAAEFVHPLFRQALYDDLPGPLRSRLHAKAFAALHGRGLDAQAAEHAIRAGMAGDMEAVAVLEEAGRAARRAAAVATAVFWLDKAATMAGDQASVQLLMDLAEAHLISGGTENATRLYRSLLARPGLEPAVRATAHWMLARALATVGQHDLAAASFADAVRLSQDTDPGSTVEILLDAAFSAWVSAGPASAMKLADQARDLAGTAGPVLRTRAQADWAEYALECGDPEGIAAAEAAPAALRAAGNSELTAEEIAWRGGWGAISSFAFCAVAVEQLAEADRYFSLVRAAAEKAAAPWAIANLAVNHSYTLARLGRLKEALAAVTVACSLTDLVPLIDAYSNVGKAYLSLYLGDLEESARLCERVGTIATARGQLNAQLILHEVLGHRALREGAIAAACAAYDKLDGMRQQMGVEEPCYPPWPRHAMSAYLAAGRVEDAERILAWLEQIAPRLSCRFPRIAAATGRAQLAELRGDRAGADGHYRSALSLHEETDLPLEHCETLLAYGAFLRRSGWPARARPVLAQAVRIAENTGAVWLGGIAREELKVAGGRLRQRTAPGDLSAQEQRVAALVVTGAANADIARQLCLSVSTIETHLERIYAKLGIHTRYQLMALSAEREFQPKN